MTRLALILMAASYAYAANAPNVTGITATFHDGQTFLTWVDPATGSAGANYRYEVYWSASPIVDTPSLAAATFLQEAFNNSGQMAAAGATWNQTTRQNGALPMSITVAGIVRRLSLCGVRHAAGGFHWAWQYTLLRPRPQRTTP